MNPRLDEAIRQAKEATAPAWDDARASRVLAGAVRRHRTHRVLRRASVVATGAAILVVALLRLTPGKGEATASAATEPEHVSEAIASLANGDAGYTRD